MEEERMTREEMIKEMMDRFNLLLSIKYSKNKDAILDRELELLRIQLVACGLSDIGTLENKYKEG